MYKIGKSGMLQSTGSKESDDLVAEQQQMYKIYI